MINPINRLQRWATTVLTQGDAEAPRVVVSDAASCERWLAEAPLADPTSASAALTTLLDELHDSELSGARYYGILEQLRPTILFVQLQIQQQTTGRGVPLAPAQKQAFNVVQKLWEQLARGYIRAYEEANSNDESIDRRRLVARALEALSGLILGHYLARQALPPAVWEKLHAMWKRLERCERRAGGVSEEPGAGEPTAADIYVFNVLLHLAQPYRLTTRQLAVARAWTIRWARKVQLTDRIAEGSVGVDLDSAQAPGLVRPDQAGRALDLAHLEQSLMKRLRALRRGTSAATLGLGNDISDAEAAELLGILYRRWCGDERKAPAAGPWKQARIAIGAKQIVPPAVSFGASPSAPKWEYSGRGRDLPNTFGSITLDDRSPQDSRFEPWRIQRQGESELIATRSESGPAIVQGDLVAIRRPEHDDLMLGNVDWVVEESLGAVRAGATIIASGVQRILATRLGSRGDDHYEPRSTVAAMLVRENDGSAVIVAVIGTIAEGERIEWSDGQGVEHARVGSQLRRGTDYAVYPLI